MKVQRLAERRRPKWAEMGDQMPAKRPLKDRFSEKVRIVDSGCHEWTGSLMPNGYGQIHNEGKTAYAHRVAWELAHGSANNLYVLHRCDNRRCVNPDHLFLGTFNDNMADMVAKTRQAIGNKNGRRKLCADEVREIRSLSGTCVELGARFGVSDATISDIRRRRSWRSI